MCVCVYIYIYIYIVVGVCGVMVIDIENGCGDTSSNPLFFSHWIDTFVEV